ncbi:SctK family type III secretion system sorting platform protein [Chelativorans sp. YIM 93263]|uniref:SctK family type III secretion system sorting platform protein n=1 Tax=Chelativorans sp. YIM 93263 TaxID=2906648 RepID=UPI002377DBF7|nr:SctK family type III secretion system sorting platform protein [Chelativorans sp. YIM 93263]
MTRSSEAGTDEPHVWRSFLQEPAAYADPEHLARSFNHAVSPAGCKRLLQSERLHERLSELLNDHFELPAPSATPESDVDEADRRVASTSRERLDEIVLRAGAVYWGNVLAGTILGRNAAALREVLNTELSTFAVANKDLAGPMQPLEPLETLRERIEADGWRCLAAWCEVVDPAISTRFRLKAPRSSPLQEAPAESFNETGPAIIRRTAL